MAGRQFTTLSYDDWVEYVFAHDVPFYDVAWYHRVDHDWWEPEPAVAVDYVTRLFRHPEPLVEAYTDDQIGQGLMFLIDNGAGAHCSYLINGSVPIAARVACVSAMTTLFARLFDPHCPEILSHLGQPGANKLSSVCYMWWDIIPLAASSKPRQPDPIHEACLAVMRETLRLGNPACQESGLHGVGHWAREYPEFAATVIDTYLRRHALRPELVQYAAAARTGCIA